MGQYPMYGSSEAQSSAPNRGALEEAAKEAQNCKEAIGRLIQTLFEDNRLTEKQVYYIGRDYEYKD